MPGGPEIQTALAGPCFRRSRGGALRAWRPPRPVSNPVPATKLRKGARRLPDGGVLGILRANRITRPGGPLNGRSERTSSREVEGQAL